MKALAAALLFAGTSQAGVIGVISTTGGGRIELHDRAGKVCAESALAAEYIPSTGKRIGGCWIIHDGQVQAIFFDGDAVRYPLHIVRLPTQL